MATVTGDRRPSTQRPSSLPWLVAAPFSVSGLIHVAHPQTFTPIVPHFLPWPTGLVYASGVAELVCAIGLWRRQRWAGIAAAVLLVAVWPANLQDSLTAQQGHDLTTQVVLWARLPLQIPLIWFALRSGRHRTPRPRPAAPPGPLGALRRRRSMPVAAPHDTNGGRRRRGTFR